MGRNFHWFYLLAEYGADFFGHPRVVQCWERGGRGGRGRWGRGGGDLAHLAQPATQLTHQLQVAVLRHLQLV